MVNGFDDTALKQEMDCKLKSEFVKGSAKEKREVKQVGKETTLDSDAQGLFEVAEVGHGDESMAC